MSNEICILNMSLLCIITQIMLYKMYTKLTHKLFHVLLHVLHIIVKTTLAWT
jgi:hypothetical protein